ncbi:MAG: hypothetical protein R3D98_02175 [Candidatus Krumholzibacteriia bacterium]
MHLFETVVGAINAISIPGFGISGDEDPAAVIALPGARDRVFNVACGSSSCAGLPRSWRHQRQVRRSQRTRRRPRPAPPPRLSATVGIGKIAGVATVIHWRPRRRSTW